MIKYLFYLLMLSDVDSTKNLHPITELETGNLLFVYKSCGAMCDAIIEVTQFKYAPYSHVGILQIDKQDTLVYEAGMNGVVATPFRKFVNKYDYVHVGKIDGLSLQFYDSVFTFIKQQVGKAYDNEFKIGNDKFYCSELIYEAFKYANNGNAYFSLNPMTFVDKHTKTLHPVWLSYFEKMNIPVPEGELGCNPSELSMDSRLEMYKY